MSKNLKTKKQNRINYLKNNLILNYFIKTINKKYKSKLKLKDLDLYGLLIVQDNMKLSELNDFELILIRLDIHFENLLFDYGYVSMFS